MNHGFERPEEFDWEAELAKDYLTDDDLEAEELNPPVIEGEMMDINGQAIKKGDWINIKDIRLQVDMTGFVLDLDKELGYVYAFVLDTYQMSYVPIHRVSVQVMPFSHTIEDIDVLIDIALQYKDKDWFMELTELRKTLEQRKSPL
jgi:hypothetical protein